MTDRQQRTSKPRAPGKATFGGETVEARILLSATWITGTDGNETINGNNGDDCIDGGAGNDILHGNNGDDVLVGGAGNDALFGGSGTDTADYSTAPGPIDVNLLLGTVTGAAGNDTLNSIERVVGSDFDDTFQDGLGNGTLVGGAGDDRFYANLGNDSIDGGTGHDTIDYSRTLGPATVDLTVTSAQATGAAGRDTLRNIEAVVGTSFSDTFAFTNPTSGSTYTVDGGRGSDAIDLSHYASSAATISANAVTVDMGGGNSFHIDFSNIEHLKFSDGTLLPGSQVQNHAPSVDAGVDQIVNEGDVVTLHGQNSLDVDGDTLTYSWVQTSGPTVTLSDATAAQPTFTAPEGLADSTVQFSLTVHDGELSSTVDHIAVTIHADDDAPIAEAGALQKVTEGDLVILNGGASFDPEGQPLSYHWVQTGGPKVTLDGADTASATFTAPEGLHPDSFQFDLTVSDGTHRSHDTVVVQVDADDDAPVVDGAGKQAAAAGQSVTLSPNVHDPEGQRLTYKWQQVGGPAVRLDNASAEHPTFTAPDDVVGTSLVFTVTASDGTSTTTNTVAVDVAQNAAPELHVVNTPTTTPGAVVVISSGATDAENNPLTYRWTQVAGAPVTLLATNQPDISFLAPQVARDSTLVFQVEVSDAHSTTTQTVSVTVTANVEPTTNAPVASASSSMVTTTAAPADTPIAVTSGTETVPVARVTTTGGSSSDIVAHSQPLSAEVANLPNDTNPASGTSSLVSRATEPRETADTDSQVVIDRIVLDAEDNLANHEALANQPDLVIAEAGHELDLTPRLPAAGPTTTYNWTQVGGTPIALDGVEGRVLRIRLPEVFVEEELVFEVELVADGQRTVQEITVQVQPVSMMTRPLALDAPVADHSDEVFGDTAIETGRGLGKVWAAMLSFWSAQPNRNRQ